MIRGRGTRAAPGAWPAPSPGDAGAGWGQTAPPEVAAVGLGLLTGFGVPEVGLEPPGKGGVREWGGRSSSGDGGERSQGRAPSTQQMDPKRATHYEGEAGQSASP